MPQVQKNLIKFLKKNIILAVTVIVLVTSFISVSAMELVAPDEFKPTKGIQKILSLNNKESESQITNSEELEPSSIANVSSSMMSSSSEKVIVEESSSVSSSSEQSVSSSEISSYSVSSSSKQDSTSSSQISSYSAKSFSSISSATPTKKSSNSVKSSSSKYYSVPYTTTKREGSPLCGINEEYPEIAKKQRKLIAFKGGYGWHGKIGVLFSTDTVTMQPDQPFYYQSENTAEVWCHPHRVVDDIPQFINNPYQIKTDCTAIDIKNLKAVLQPFKEISEFGCIKVKKSYNREFYVYNKEIDQLYRVYINNTSDSLNIKSVKYFCDQDEEYIGEDWVKRSWKNQHLCDKNIGM